MSVRKNKFITFLAIKCSIVAKHIAKPSSVEVPKQQLEIARNFQSRTTPPLISQYIWKQVKHLMEKNEKKIYFLRVHRWRSVIFRLHTQEWRPFRSSPKQTLTSALLNRRCGRCERRCAWTLQFIHVRFLANCNMRTDAMKTHQWKSRTKPPGNIAIKQ